MQLDTRSRLRFELFTLDILRSIYLLKLIPALYITATSKQEHNHAANAHRRAYPEEYLPSVDRILV